MASILLVRYFFHTYPACLWLYKFLINFKTCVLQFPLFSQLSLEISFRGRAQFLPVDRPAWSPLVGYAITWWLKGWDAFWCRTRLPWVSRFNILFVHCESLVWIYIFIRVLSWFPSYASFPWLSTALYSLQGYHPWVWGSNVYSCTVHLPL